MNPLLLGGVLEFGGKILDRLFPNAEERARAEAEMLKLTMEGDLKQVLAQLEINAAEAKHASVFVAGWRPFIGWACGAGFVYATLGLPLLSWLAAAQGWPAPPVFDTEILQTTLYGMLGIAALRTVEKVKQVPNTSLK